MPRDYKNIVDENLPLTDVKYETSEVLAAQKVSVVVEDLKIRCYQS